jgi:hypothetical protein
MPPTNPISLNSLLKMKKYADSQLGRPYSIKGYLKGREVEGFHCAEYVGEILEMGRIIRSDKYRESPGGIYDKVMKPPTHYAR